MKIWLQTATLLKKSNLNISPLGHDRDKLKSISMMMGTRRRTMRRTIRRGTMTNLHFGGLEES